jgi:hypothetical protein
MNDDVGVFTRSAASGRGRRGTKTIRGARQLGPDPGASPPPLLQGWDEDVSDRIYQTTTTTTTTLGIHSVLVRRSASM